MVPLPIFIEYFDLSSPYDTAFCNWCISDESDMATVWKEE